MVWLSPWLRGPLLLLRRPGVALAVLAAAMVATVPASAFPMFVSSAGSAAFQGRADGTCSWTLGSQLSMGPIYGPGTDAAADLVKRTNVEAAALASTPRVGTPAITLYRDDVTLAAASNSAPTGVMLASRTGFADHVSALAGPRGSGLWLPDSMAKRSGLSVGDAVELTTPAGVWTRLGPDGNQIPVDTPPFKTSVAAIYADLTSMPDSPFWCSSRTLYRGKAGPDSNSQVVPDLLLTDQNTFLALAQTFGEVGAHNGLMIERQVDIRGLTASQALETSNNIDVAQRGMLALARPSGPLSSDESHPTIVRSDLRQYAQRARLVGQSLRPTAFAASVAGVGIGLLVVLAAAAFWVQRRRRELAVLAAHGVGAWALGVKAAFEAALPLIVGAALGCSAAYLLVDTTGPSALIDKEAIHAGWIGAAAVLGASLIITTVTSGFGARPLTDRALPGARRIHLLRSLPWETLLLAAAVPAWTLLGGSHLTSLNNDAIYGQIASVPVRLFVAPMLAVAGTVVLCARLSALVMRRCARLAVRSPVRLLTLRRITREWLATCVLIAATAGPVALAAFGATVAQSATNTLMSQAKLGIGSDTVITMTGPAATPPSLAGHATQVLRLDGAQLGGVTASLLEIDPITFAAGAYWDTRIDGRSMGEIAAPVRPPGAGQITVVVAASPVASGIQQLTTGSGGTISVQVRALPLLPAEQAGYPTVLVPPGTLDKLELADRAERQLWVRGNPRQIHEDALAAHLPINAFTDSETIFEHTWIEPVTYSFRYLTGICALAGLVAAVGLVLYLEAVTPARRRAWVLLRRMGLRSRQHQWSLMAQIAIPVGYGAIVGLCLAATLAIITRSDMDVVPGLPPQTLLSPPVRMLASAIVAIGIVIILTASTAHARIKNARPSEVLRDVD
jgi:putative ABC transport system permease protein